MLQATVLALDTMLIQSKAMPWTLRWKAVHYFVACHKYLSRCSKRSQWYMGLHWLRPASTLIAEPHDTCLLTMFAPNGLAHLIQGWPIPIGSWMAHLIQGWPTWPMHARFSLWIQSHVSWGAQMGESGIEAQSLSELCNDPSSAVDRMSHAHLCAVAWAFKRA